MAHCPADVATQGALMTTILCLCGSLRRESHNRAALEAAQILAPSNVALQIADISTLPLFNPDSTPNTAVISLFQAVASADGVLIASPEYARGISGVLKNALDWLVSDECFPNMPVALINTSPRASDAIKALTLVLKTMSANIVAPACISLPLLGTALKSKDIAADAKLAPALRKMLDTLVKETKNNPRLAAIEKGPAQ